MVIGSQADHVTMMMTTDTPAIAALTTVHATVMGPEHVTRMMQAPNDTSMNDSCGSACHA